MIARPALLAASLSLLIAGCAMEDSGGQAMGFSNCFKKKVSAQLRYCLASEAAEDDFYRIQGRHQIIYGRYNGPASMAKEGLSLCLTGQENRSLVNACTPEEVVELASETLGSAEASMCEAVIDPRKTLSGC